MKKAKNLTKTLVIALALLLAFAISLGLSGAWYNASRRASGTITMTGGIIIDYSGFGQAQDGTWGKEEDDEISFLLFSEQENALPGASIALNNAGIKANDASVDFYARVKLTYKFFTDAAGLTDVTSQISSYSDFISTPAFASAWVDSNNNDGYYYYATGTTLNAIPKEATLGNGNYVDIFASSQSIVLNGEAAGFNHEGGGYQYNEDILIKRIEVYLTLETLQANQAAATANSWAISEPAAQYTDNAGVVYTQNPNSTWTLTDGTALSSDSSSTSASTLSATIYDNASYSYTILSTIDGQNVTAIGDEAFLNASQLTSVTIPTTVSTIGVRAFEGTGLNAITLTENVTSVGEDALNTNSLTEVTIENEDSVITGIATAGIPTASVVNVPSAILSGYETTLSGYSNLAAIPEPSQGLAYSYDSSTQSYTLTGIGTCTDTALIIPSTYDDGTSGEHSVTKIEDNAFLRCNKLTSITIPSSVTSIGKYAFYQCTTLNSLTIPSSVISIGDGVFQHCYALTTLIIPSSVTSIGSEAFCSCANLTSIVISSSITIIGNNPFDYCERLQLFSGGNSTYQVSGDGRCLICVNGNEQILIGFARAGLTEYTMPSSVTSIGYRAFGGCSRLASITMPQFVTSIGYGAFSGCTGLTSITIPSSVGSIDGFAFSGCTTLTTITIDSTTIAALSSSNSRLLDNATTVYVLEGLTVGTYITDSFSTTTSDKAGYVKYVKNA